MKAKLAMVRDFVGVEMKIKVLTLQVVAGVAYAIPTPGSQVSDGN
jgi:hypothetical protein